MIRGERILIPAVKRQHSLQTAAAFEGHSESGMERVVFGTSESRIDRRHSVYNGLLVLGDPADEALAHPDFQRTEHILVFARRMLCNQRIPLRNEYRHCVIRNHWAQPVFNAVQNPTEIEG